MREIALEGKVYSHTRYAIDALAWATNRRGHNEWKSDNVVDEVWNYLHRNNVKMETDNFNHSETVLVGKTTVRRAMLRLADAGFARIKHSENGRYIREFEFKADVILTGHGIEKHPATQAADPIDRLKESARVLNDTVERPGLPELPMPEKPFERYRADEIDDLLAEYQRHDPDAHADYIDRLIDTLKVVLNG